MSRNISLSFGKDAADPAANKTCMWIFAFVDGGHLSIDSSR
jgi:hypothetical protein